MHTMQDICIFAHYDRDGIVDQHVLHYLKALKDCGFATVFVTASPIDEASRTEVGRHCIDCIERENVGHDFGSWPAGLARWRDRVSGRLLLANDSVYGPLLPLKPQLDRMTAQ
jgi:rhamnosyltransferase